MQIKRIVKIYSQLEQEWTFYEVTNPNLVLPEYTDYYGKESRQDREFSEFINKNLDDFKQVDENDLIGIPILIHGNYSE